MTYDEADDMCPNCITPWKCNGPHLDPDEALTPEEARIIIDAGYDPEAILEFLFGEDGHSADDRDTDFPERDDPDV